MNFQEFSIHSRSVAVYGGHYRADPLKAVVVLVHGLGEHSGRYHENVIPTMLENGLAVVTYDNFGHGRTKGKRGHCTGYEALLDLLQQLIDKAKALYPDIPLFLYGHSMGGNLVLNYSMRRNIFVAGIVATSPYLRLAFQPPKWKMVLGKLFLGLFPSITLASGLDPAGISRIAAEVTKYSKDPLVHDKVSPMFSFPVMDAGEWAINNASRLNVPTLLLHGTADPIIDYKATKEFHENSEVTELVLIDGGYHELHHDLCKAELLESVTQWITKHL